MNFVNNYNAQDRIIGISLIIKIALPFPRYFGEEVKKICVIIYF